MKEGDPCEHPRDETLNLPGTEPERHPRWYTDDGYNYYEESSSTLRGRNLETYEPYKPGEHGEVFPEDPRGRVGKIYVDEDDNLYCPVCGHRLKAGF